MIDQYLARGELIPDELAVSLCLHDLEARVRAGDFHPATDLLVLDGIPRTVRQAALLEGRVTVLKILHLVCVDVEEVVRRLRQRATQQGRQDDSDEWVIRHRMEIYAREIDAVLEYYLPELIATIDARKLPAEVIDQILHQVIPILNQRRAMPQHSSSLPAQCLLLDSSRRSDV